MWTCGSGLVGLWTCRTVDWWKCGVIEMWSGGNVTASGAMDCCDCKLQNYRLVVMWTCRTVDWWQCDCQWDYGVM